MTRYDRAQSPGASSDCAPDDAKRECDERQQLSILREWLKAREAEHLEEGSPAAVAVLGALKKLNPLGRLFS